MDQNIIPPTVKKFKFKKDYIAACKNGVIFGRRDRTGKHLTMLQEGKRFTMHITNPKKGDRQHLFSSENSANKQIEWEAQIKSLLLKSSLKKKPKWVYAIPKSAFRMDFVISKNGKECMALFPTGSRLLRSVVRMSYSNFTTSDCFIGFTSAGSLVMRGRGMTIIITKKAMRRLTRLFLQIPFFVALSKGIKMMKSEKNIQPVA